MDEHGEVLLDVDGLTLEEVSFSNEGTILPLDTMDLLEGIIDLELKLLFLILEGWL